MNDTEYRTKRECALLAAAAIFLAGAASVQAVRRSEVRQENQAQEMVLKEVSTEYRSGMELKEASSADLLEGQDGLTVLVNKTHALRPGYETDLHWLENKSCAVAEVMYDSLKAMLTDGSEEGLEFVVASGYRSRERQQELLWEDIETAMETQGLSWQEAYNQETQETMPPGYSEHETGLAVDIVALDYQILDEQQEDTEENRWLQENCGKYGFILRYPRGKEEVTGVSYEAWHFRYVGQEAAQEITEKQITLEEYLGEE